MKRPKIISALEMSDEQILQTAEQLRVAYKLKRILRYSGSRDFTVHSESVAEHVFALLFIAEYFLAQEAIGSSLDVAKLHRILIFHDFGEIKNGDIPYHLKTKEHEEREQRDAEETFALLPPPIRTVGYESWSDYLHHGSPEARFAYALDKVEPLFELLDPVNERSIKRLKFTYEAHIEKKIKATEEFPVMRRFAVVLSDDMLKRRIFWKES